MKALVYHGPGSRGWDDVPDAVLVDATDAVVRVTSPARAAARFASRS